MTQVESQLAVSPPPGFTALRLHLFDTPAQELARLLAEPWPRWMERLVEMEEGTKRETAAESEETQASVAVTSLSHDLTHRLGIVAFAASVLEELGWSIELRGHHLVASARMTPYEARHLLEDAGVAGTMCAVSEIDDSGWPRMWYGGDA